MEKYLHPELSVLELDASAPLLAASNEGYPVDPVDPGFSPLLTIIPPMI